MLYQFSLTAAALAAGLIGVPTHASLITLDIADIVGGGSGLGTGAFQGIDQTDGTLALAQRDFIVLPDDVAEYWPVPALPYIDGVFTPDGGAGPNQVTSTGLTSAVIPDTSRDSWDVLWNGANQLGSAVLDGFDYSQPGHSLLGFHVNKGLTLDLDAIESDHPGLQATRFTADFGLDAGSELSPGDADFWVLLDGQLADSALDVTFDDGALQFDVAIPDGVRFLTLMTTDSDVNIDWDDAVMGDPTLHLDIPAPGALALLAVAGALLPGRRRA